MNGIGGFLQNDSPFGKLMTKCGTVIAANVLFVVCCLPLITAGAALRGLYGTVFSMLDAGQEAINPFRVFWQSFRKGFVRTTLCWLAFLGILVLGAVDLQVCNAWAGPGPYFAAGVVAVLLVAVLLGLFFFPLGAVYPEKPARLLRRSLVAAVGHPLHTLGILAVNLGPVVLFLADEVGRPTYAFAGAFFAFGVMALLTARLMRPHLPQTES